MYHEGVPGHHLQIAQATFNKAELNTWRRFAGTSGHAEGYLEAFASIYADAADAIAAGRVPPGLPGIQDGLDGMRSSI